MCWEAVPILYEKQVKNGAELLPLLQAAGLGEIQGAEYTVGVFENGRPVGCGSLKGDTILGVAVDEGHQGEGISAKVVTHLIKVAAAKGLDTLYLFTRPEKEPLFAALGFRPVATARPYASMMEWGANALERFQRELAAQAFGGTPPAAALVMNCNPFTNGHKFLAERACGENEFVYVFVVEEDKSQFPFAARLALVKKGLAHLPNCRVLSSGRYAVSALTFPSYFTQEDALAQAHARLDLGVFAHRIAPVLHINKRYVGTEPLSPVTNIYNRAMGEILPGYGIQVVEIPRITAGGDVVSASRVRALMAENRLVELRALVPPATYAYIADRLLADEGGLSAQG